jgi:hypothetical protein
MKLKDIKKRDQFLSQVYTQIYHDITIISEQTYKQLFLFIHYENLNIIDENVRSYVKRVRNDIWDQILIHVKVLI